MATGSLILLDNQTVSSVSSVSLGLSNWSTSYNHYIVNWANTTFSVDGVSFRMRVFASSIYLNTEEEIGNNTYGTSFYKNIKINATHYNDIKNYDVYKKMYDISDEDDYQLLNRVKMKYNRCILYDGLLLHSIDKESFKKDIFKNTWRLNQMIFSVYEPQEIWN